MQPEHVEFLEELGFTPTEAKVYLTLLSRGESLAGPIADEARLYRKNTLDALESLADRGFVARATRNGRSYWQAVSPERIKGLIRDRLSQADRIVPELLSAFNRKGTGVPVEVYQGADGERAFADLVLREGKPLFFLGATEEFAIPADVPLHLLLAPKTPMPEKTPGISARRLPKAAVPALPMCAFGEYAAILIPAKEPVVIAAKSPDAAASIKRQFDALWKAAK